MSLSLLPIAAAATIGIQVLIDGSVVTLVDVPQSAWFSGHVQAAAEAGIVSGYRDASGKPTGRYGPADRITIAEALKIASEGAGYDESAYSAIVSSGVNHWSSPYVSVAKAEHFAVVRPGVSLDRAATRAEVAAIFASAFRVDTEDVPVGTYTDVGVSTENAASIEALSRDGIVSGDTSADGRAMGTFRPTAAINRAEVAKIVMRSREVHNVPGQGRAPSDTASEEEPSETPLVVYSDAGFSPQVIRVRKGQTVVFRNDTTASMRVASDPHPMHTALPAFDSETGLKQGLTYTFTFNALGTWSYHNHLHPQHTGTVVVEE